MAAVTVQAESGLSGVTTADWLIPAKYTGICQVYTTLHEIYPEIITTQKQTKKKDVSSTKEYDT